MALIDHIVWGGRDLDGGIEKMADMTGVTAQKGGAHPGNGTCNALMSLGSLQYLEIIAPDKTQDLTGTHGEMLGTLKADGVLTFCMENGDLEVEADLVRGLNLIPDGPNDWSRQAPDGTLLRWRLLMVEGHDYGFQIPFFIDWLDCVHPSTVTPSGVALAAFQVATPRAEDLSKIYNGLNIECPVVQASEPAMTATLETPKGSVVLTPALF